MKPPIKPTAQPIEYTHNALAISKTTNEKKPMILTRNRAMQRISYYLHKPLTHHPWRGQAVNPPADVPARRYAWWQLSFHITNKFA